MERVERRPYRWGAGSEHGRPRIALPMLLAAPGLSLALWVLIGIALLAFG